MIATSTLFIIALAIGGLCLATAIVAILLAWRSLKKPK